MVNCLFFHDWRTIFGVEDWQWYTPDPLPGDNPVATVLDHVAQTNLPPGWVVLNVFQGIKNVLPHLFDGNEPLVSGPEDDWLLGPPVKRVGVLEWFFQQEGVVIFQLLQGDIVGLLVEDAIEVRTIVLSQDTLVVDWGKDWQVVLLTEVVVIVTITRSGVDQTSTSIGSNVVGVPNQQFPVDVWVLSRHPFHVRARKVVNDFVIVPAQLLCQVSQQFSANNVLTVITGRLNNGVVELRINGNGFRSGDRPWSRRPNNQVSVVV